MKIYQKKNSTLEDETVLVELERRHTLKEVGNEADSDDDRRKTTRAKSLGIFEEGHSSSDIEPAIEKKSGFTRKPTIITESELSSSRLYKDRKAKVNSDDENIEDSISTLPSEGRESLEPRALQDPNLKPIPVSTHRPRRMSTCCWYFTIVLIICIACLAVTAGVGGIIYMEYFSTSKDKIGTMETEKITKNDKSTSDIKENFQHPPLKHDDMHQNEPKIPDHILKDLLKNSAGIEQGYDVPKIVTKKDTQPMENMLHDKDYPYSNKIRDKVLKDIKNSFLSISHDIEMTEHSRNAKLPDIFENVHASITDFNVTTSDKSAKVNPNAQNQDLLDFNLNQNMDIKDTISDRNVDDVSEKITGIERFTAEKSKSEAELSESSNETSGFARNFNFGERTTLQGSELKVDRVNEDVPFESHIKEKRIEQSIEIAPNSNNFEPMENSFENLKFPSIHNLEDNSLVHVEDNSLDQTENLPHQFNESFNDLKKTRNVFESDDSSSEEQLVADGHNQNSDDSSLKKLIVADDHNQNSDHSSSEKHLEGDDINQNSDDSSSENHLVADGNNKISDESAQLVFIRPIVESKPVPVPLAFLRRIGFDIKNPSSHEPMTAKDMDIKFSLAEALKYLRSLDTDNNLPTSREKNATRKPSNQEESKKTNLPILTERKEYLNILRKKIFEQSL